MRRRQINQMRQAETKKTSLGEIIVAIEKNLEILKPKNSCPKCGKEFKRGLHLHAKACRV